MSSTNIDLCTDIGYVSLNHVGEQLCGDHVEVVSPEGGTSTVVVLADGLGSGVKASILSTLTAKIISTMMAAGMKLEDAVETIIATLPVCAVRGVAYSTFTVLHFVDNFRAEIIQYDNPRVILLRNGKNYEMPTTRVSIAGKEILRSEIELSENDVFIAFSDGVEHAGVGGIYSFGWKREDIISFVEKYWDVKSSAMEMTSVLLDECERLYDGRPGDDATVCTVRIRPSQPVNLLYGPPSNRNDNYKMMSQFFERDGKHIVCGGTTSSIAAQYLDKPLRVGFEYFDPEIPPVAELEGVDLVTEGVITVNRVVEYARQYLEDGKSYEDWCDKQDGASRIARMLCVDATEIHFFVGCAVNPAHQNPNLPINFNIKMHLIKDLADVLGRIGKVVKVTYY